MMYKTNMKTAKRRLTADISRELISIYYYLKISSAYSVFLYAKSVNPLTNTEIRDGFDFIGTPAGFGLH